MPARPRGGPGGYGGPMRAPVLVLSNVSQLRLKYPNFIGRCGNKEGEREKSAVRKHYCSCCTHETTRSETLTLLDCSFRHQDLPWSLLHVKNDFGCTRRDTVDK